METKNLLIVSHRPLTDEEIWMRAAQAEETGAAIVVVRPLGDEVRGDFLKEVGRIWEGRLCR